MRRGSAVLLAVAAASLAACPAQRRTLSREDLLRSLQEPAGPTAALPTLAELQALRVPSPAALPAALESEARAALASRNGPSPLERARLAIAILGDVAAAELAWAEAPKLSDAERAELYGHRCLTERALRRYPELIAACTGALDAAPEHPYAAAWAFTLFRSRSATDAADRAFVDSHARWRAGCEARRGPAQSCADLAFVLAEGARLAHEARKEEGAARAAVRARGALTEATVQGPYDGAERFALGAAPPAPPRALPGRTFEVRRGPWDGEHAPARRGARGLYRLTFDVEGGGDVTFFVTGRGALHLTVDGEVLLERRPMLNEEPWVSRVGAQLARGAHRVELWVQGLGAGDRIMIAALDAAGRPALRPLAQGDATLAGASARPPLPGPLEAAQRARQGEGLDALDASLVSLHLGKSGFGVPGERVREEVRALLGRFGYAPQALVLAASAVGEDDTVPVRFARAEAAPLWQRLEERWPGHPVARITKARALEEERPEEALDAYRALVEAHPRYPFGQRELIGLALERGLTDEALRAAEALLAVERSRANLEAALPALREAGRLVEAAQAEREMAERAPGLYADAKARWRLKAGRTEEAVVELTRVCDAEPGHPAEELLVSLLELERPEEALSRVEALLAAFPNDAASWRRRIALSSLLRGEQVALGLAQRAELRAGADRELAELLEELGREPLWAMRLAAGDAAIAARAEEAERPFPGYPVLMRVDHMERHLREDLSAIALRHFVVQLDSEAALDSFGEVRFGSRSRLVRLRVVKPDGRVLEPEHPPGVEDISLTGLGLGDLVEALWVSYEPPPRTGGIAFESFELSQRAPALERAYVLTAPKALAQDPRFELVSRGGLPTPAVSEAGGRVRWAFVAEDVPARLDEAHAPAPEEFVPLAGYAFATDEEHWALWRGRALVAKARREPWLDEAAARIAGGGAPEERIARLFRFVVSRISEAEGPFTALSTLATGQGDRVALLLALARAAGLDAEPVALQLPTLPPPEVLSGRAFRTLGVRVSLPDGPRYAFVGSDLAVLDGLPPMAKGSHVLDVSLGALESGLPRTERLPDGAISTQPVKMQLNLEVKQPDKLEGLLALTLPTYLAEPLRRGLRQATSAQLVALFEQALGESLPGVRVLEIKSPRLEAAGEPLGIGVSLEVPLRTDSKEPIRFERLFGQGASSALGLFVPLSSYLRVGERSQPLLVNAAVEALEVQLTLPDGAAFIEAPERLDLAAGPFELRQRATVTDGTLFWTRELSAKNARVTPEDWPSLRTRLTALAGRSEARVAFLVVPSPSPEG